MVWGIDIPVPNPAKARNIRRRAESFILALNRDIRRAFRVPVDDLMKKEVDSDWWQKEVKRPESQRRKFTDLVVEHTDLTADQVKHHSLEPIFHIEWDEFRREFFDWKGKANMWWPDAVNEARTYLDRAQKYQERFNALAEKYGERSDVDLPVREGRLSWMYWVGGIILILVIAGIVLWIWL